MARHPFSRRARRRMRDPYDFCPCIGTARAKRCSYGCRAVWRPMDKYGVYRTTFRMNEIARGSAPQVLARLEAEISQHVAAKRAVQQAKACWKE